MNQQLHGFYSQKDANQHGYCVYTTPDGKSVNVTFVCPVINWSDHYKWDDTIYIGPVVKCIRSESKITTP